MNIDLLDRKLNALQSAEQAGLITATARRAIVTRLLYSTGIVAQMQALIDGAPDLLVDHAEIADTQDGFELHVHIPAGSLSHWRERLAAQGFAEGYLSDAGFEYRGAFTLRLTRRRRSRDWLAMGVAA